MFAFVVLLCQLLDMCSSAVFTSKVLPLGRCNVLGLFRSSKPRHKAPPAPPRCKVWYKSQQQQSCPPAPPFIGGWGVGQGCNVPNNRPDAIKVALYDGNQLRNMTNPPAVGTADERHCTFYEVRPACWHNSTTKACSGVFFYFCSF